MICEIYVSNKAIMKSNSKYTRNYKFWLWCFAVSILQTGKLRVSAIRKHTQIPSRPEKPLQALLSKVCLGGRGWKRQMQTEYGGHLFLKRRKKIISCTGMFLFKKKPLQSHRTCLPALKKQGGLFQLSGAWNVCLQEHPDSCNNKHVQLQELCLTSLDNTVWIPFLWPS